MESRPHSTVYMYMHRMTCRPGDESFMKVRTCNVLSPRRDTFMYMGALVV